jgi:hypothetical protein
LPAGLVSWTMTSLPGTPHKSAASPARTTSLIEELRGVEETN